MVNHRLKTPLQIMARLAASSNPVQRIFRIDYPVYILPVKMKERMSEPYESLEWFIIRALAEGNVASSAELAALLGFEEKSKLLEETLVHLAFIDHIELGPDQQRADLVITKLGLESHALRQKVYAVESRRLLYFDALGLQPLERSFYEDATFRLYPLEDREILHKSHTVDLWGSMAADKLQALLSLNGAERYRCNLPQEMNDIAFDLDSFSGEGVPALTGLIHFAPLYVVTLATDEEMEHGMQNQALHEVPFEIYGGANGKRLPFFEQLILQQYAVLHPMWRSVFSREFAFTDELLIEGLQLHPLIQLGRCQVNEVGNLTYTLHETDIAKWRETDHFQRIVRHLPKTRHLPLTDAAISGRVLILRKGNAQSQDALLELLQENLTEHLTSKGYSAPYIKKQQQELRRQFDETWGS
ncbi:hypothetical protein PAECIP111893_01871 [Paenibacillus plantiphilus]|uniref:Uncharacterized protein n=1 Tax=Paenibacillus plantiphilus TaxID=2905650 RepID=A0ABM9C511_9BACL|nr:hypothetical protein [Paenibacillus plantiphilus]CAH1202662.1 hypothetical protein PAECIP111893_01871 [Paenibacillus plantiphilus]